MEFWLTVIAAAALLFIAAVGFTGSVTNTGRKRQVNIFGIGSGNKGAIMPESKPLYLVFVCPNCIAIRHFKLKGDGSNIYCCTVCKLEVEYNDGVITKVAVSGRPEAERTVRNPYGRRGKP